MLVDLLHRWQGCGAIVLGASSIIDCLALLLFLLALNKHLLQVADIRVDLLLLLIVLDGLGVRRLRAHRTCRLGQTGGHSAGQILLFS